MIKVGQEIEVIVTGIVNYGLFVKKDDFIGLIHISELSDKFVRDIELFACVGDKITVQVLEVDLNTKKMKLSFKKCKKRKAVIVSDLPIGFVPIKKALPKWIRQAKGYLKDD